MQQLPESFEKRVYEQLGNEFDSFRQALHEEVPVSIRYNPAKMSEKPACEPVPWCTQACYLPQRPVFTLDPLFHAGVYYVQEASSMLIEQAYRQISRENRALRILDLCAAPGGKSTHLLSLMNPNSLLVSNEVIQSRVNILSENIARWGHANVIVTNLDPRIFARLEGFFDIILVDAPCSGEGLFRKDPKAVNEWSPDNAANCALRQRRILHDVLPALKEGGQLIYSSCTYNPAENIEQLTAFSNIYQLSSVRLASLADYGVQELYLDNIYAYQCWPHRLKGEGFFMGILQKEGQRENKYKSVKKLTVVSQKKISATAWLDAPENLLLFESRENEISILPKELTEDAEIILSHLPVRQIGTHVLSQKARNLIPTHELALSIHKSSQLPVTELCLEDALQYLRRNDIRTDYPGDGWRILSYQQQALGWVNGVSGRLNNKLPQEYRIRTL